jgi:hypothetical protein
LILKVVVDSIGETQCRQEWHSLEVPVVLCQEASSSLVGALPHHREKDPFRAALANTGELAASEGLAGRFSSRQASKVELWVEHPQAEG